MHRSSCGQSRPADRIVDLREQEGTPVRVGRAHEVRRTLGDQLPERPFELRRRRRFGRVDIDAREQHLPYGGFDLVSIGAHETIAHRVCRCAGVPAPNEGLEPGALRMIAYGLLVEQLDQQIVPAREEQRPVVDLDLQHVFRLRVPGNRDQAVVDLLRARAEVVLRAERRFVTANRRLRRAIVDRARVRRPDPAGGGIEELRVSRRRRPRRVAAETQFGIRGGGNAAGDGPGDVPIACRPPSGSRGYADRRCECDSLRGGGRRLERRDIEVGGCRHCREPAREPAAAG